MSRNSFFSVRGFKDNYMTFLEGMEQKTYVNTYLILPRTQVLTLVYDSLFMNIFFLPSAELPCTRTLVYKITMSYHGFLCTYHYV